MIDITLLHYKPLDGQRESAISALQERAFWSKINVTENIKECWLWSGAKNTKGYGNLRINKRYYHAHRIAFWLINGKIPCGYIVCHICDNPSCCNPHHLMLGTIKSNSADMLIKNRQKKPESAARGINNAKAKLSDAIVIEIRNKYKKESANQYRLAELYGVSQSTISALVRNKTWRHVSG